MSDLWHQQRRDRAMSIGGGILLALMTVCSKAFAILPPPETADLLFVANGNYANEALLEGHFDDLSYNVVKLKDYQVTSSTNFGGYDLVVITGFAPNITTSAMNALLASGTPVLAISYWNQGYAKKLGLVTTSSAEYYGGASVALDGLAPDSLARYLGLSPAVYTTSYTIYGALDDQVAPGVEIVARHGLDLDLAVALYNGTTKRAALGAYDGQRYTVDGWRLVDLLLARLAPPGPLWGSTVEQAQGYVDSGLAAYVAQVAADPSSYPVSEVRATVWNALLAWSLLPLWNQIIAPLPAPVRDGWGTLDPDFFLPVQLPKIHHPRCGYPNDKWFAGQAWMEIPDGPDSDTEPDGCTEQYYPDCPDCQVYDEKLSEPIETVPDLDLGGPYWPAEARALLTNAEYDQLRAAITEVKKSYFVRGTDMGASVQLGGTTYFYMGDTWGFTADCTDNDGDAACTNDFTVKNDAILTSTDTNYADGVTAHAILKPRSTAALGFWGLGIDGVHYGWEPYENDLWDPINTFVPVEPPFTTTGSAFQMTKTWTVALPPPFVSVPMSLQTVVVNYNTASQGRADGQQITPSFLVGDHTGGWNVCTLATRDCNVPPARKNPRAFMGCSLDGVHFTNCYQQPGFPWSSNPPFSFDGFEFENCLDKREIKWTHKARFAGFAAVQLSAADLDLVCNWDTGIEPESALCVFEGSGGGILLYGKPRPAGSGPVTLAFIANDDLGELWNIWEDNAVLEAPKVYYYAGPGLGEYGTEWHTSEQHAAPLPQYVWTNGFPCDEDKMAALPSGAIPYYDPALDEAFAAAKAAIVNADDSAIIEGIGLTMAAYNEQVLGITKAEATAWTDWHDGAFRANLDEAMTRLAVITDPNNFDDYTPQERQAANSNYWVYVAFKNLVRYRDCSANTGVGARYTPETCLLTAAQRTEGASLASVRIVRDPDPSQPMLLLFGGNKYRWAPVNRPWDISSPIGVNRQVDWQGNTVENDVEGYGTFILAGEQGLVYDPTASSAGAYPSTGLLHVTHTVSTWDGANAAPYGVYTRKTTLVWPPLPVMIPSPPESDPLIRPYFYVTPATSSPWPSYDEVAFDRIMRGVQVLVP